MDDVVAEAYRLAREGYGYENIMRMLRMGEGQARYIVLGKDAYMRWKSKQEEKVAS